MYTETCILLIVYPALSYASGNYNKGHDWAMKGIQERQPSSSLRPDEVLFNGYWPSYQLPSQSYNEAFQLPIESYNEADLDTEWHVSMINELMYQPGEEYVDSDANQQETIMSDATEAGASMRSSHRGKTWPPFPPAKWQRDLLKEQVRMIHDRLTESWSSDTSDHVAKKVLASANRWLQINPDIVKGLLKGDETVWGMAIGRNRPVLNNSNANAVKRGKKNQRLYLVDPVWLCKPILNKKRDFIYERLSSHWNCNSEALVISRLDQYTEKYGKISSPEALLEEDDQERFRMAADAIYCQGAPKGMRNVGASENDLLHQYSEQYSIKVEGQEGKAEHVLREPRMKSNAARFRTGQAWLATMTLNQVAKIHKSIRIHWKDKLDNRIIKGALVHANEILQRDMNLLERCKSGDDMAAYIVAKQCVSPEYMKDLD